MATVQPDDDVNNTAKWLVGMAITILSGVIWFVVAHEHRVTELEVRGMQRSESDKLIAAAITDLSHTLRDISDRVVKIEATRYTIADGGKASAEILSALKAHADAEALAVGKLAEKVDTLHDHMIRLDATKEAQKKP